jgi:hypothetical protein
MKVEEERNYVWVGLGRAAVFRRTKSLIRFNSSFFSVCFFPFLRDCFLKNECPWSMYNSNRIRQQIHSHIYLLEFRINLLRILLYLRINLLRKKK